MQIDENASIAAVVRRAWANLHAVKTFLRPQDSPQTEVRGVDESHILFATVVDSDDSRGIWIGLTPHKQQSDPAVGRVSILVAWIEGLTIIVAKQSSAAFRQDARKIGFTEGIKSE